MSRKNKKFIETVAISATAWFVFKAALQGVIGWIAARFFAKWWLSKEKPKDVKNISQEEQIEET